MDLNKFFFFAKMFESNVLFGQIMLSEHWYAFSEGTDKHGWAFGSGGMKEKDEVENSLKASIKLRLIKHVLPISLFYNLQTHSLRLCKIRSEDWWLSLELNGGTYYNDKISSFCFISAECHFIETKQDDFWSKRSGHFLMHA